MFCVTLILFASFLGPGKGPGSSFKKLSHNDVIQQYPIKVPRSTHIPELMSFDMALLNNTNKIGPSVDSYGTR